MSRILNRVLNALGLVLRPEGGQVTTDQIALDTPIQLVYAVERQAELGAAYGRETTGRGWWLMNISLNLTGAGTMYSVASINPYTVIGIAASGMPGVNPLEYDCWLMDLFVLDIAVANSITNVALSIQYPNLPGITTGTPVELVFYSAANIPMSAVGGGSDVQGYNPSFKCELPRYLPFGATIASRTVATGASATANIHALVFVCPKGTTPPGVA